MGTAEESLAVEAVDAINDIAGIHPGYRAAHAKGSLWRGTFTATVDAARLTRAAHMQGQPIDATIRFSNGNGDPHAPDYARDGRGMAVKFYLPDDTRTDIVALTLPVFFARTPGDFVEFTRARRPDPETGQPDLQRLGAFLGAHPEAQPAIQAALSAEPPASYVRCVYHGIHAFRWVDEESDGRHLRYRWEPEEGVAAIDEDEARSRGPNYLQDEMIERIERAPAAFRLALQLAEDGDPVDDPTAAWPGERETVIAGRLEITAPERERERGGDVLVFDPTRVCDGIECSDDPVLRFRSRAYSVSVERRSAAVGPAA